MPKDILTDDHNTPYYKFIWYLVVRISNSIEASTVVQNDKLSIYAYFGFHFSVTMVSQKRSFLKQRFCLTVPSRTSLDN